MIFKNSFKHLIHLIIFIPFLFGCGRSLETEINNEVLSRAGLEDYSVVLESTHTVNGEITSDKKIFNNNALVRIPAFIQVREGNAGNHWARVYFNVLNNEAEFYCDYKGGAFSESPDSDWEIEKGLKYHFYGCFQDVDFDGEVDELNYYPGLESIQDRDHSIDLEILSADPRYNTKAQALIEIEWH